MANCGRQAHRTAAALLRRAWHETALLCLVGLATLGCGTGAEALSEASLRITYPKIKIHSHTVVDHEPGTFAAFPANRGAQQWVWGNEILVGYGKGKFKEQDGHNYDGKVRSMLARSLDGGATWTPYRAKWGSANDAPKPGKIDLADPNFAMFIDDGSKSFVLSNDRGRTWSKRHDFSDLLGRSPLKGKDFEARTDYVVNSSDSAFFFMASSRDGLFNDEDYVYMVETRDAGKTFRYVSKIAPDDDARATMPSTVRTGKRRLVSCVRRREERNKNWIDCYHTKDNGQKWTHLAEVDGTGFRNGNPPALVRQDDGTLVLVYGVRRGNDRRAAKWSSISVKVSTDGGYHWSGEARLRRDFVGFDKHQDTDLGYARAFVRPDGKIVAVYYWATNARYEQHIAATIFELRH